jgi:hypothetical protein
MQMRRFTRLTIAFSKKFENHTYMVAIYAVWYNLSEAAQAFETAFASDGCWR